MHDVYEWLFSALSGAVAAFFVQYGLAIALVAVAVVLDVITVIRWLRYKLSSR